MSGHTARRSGGAQTAPPSVSEQVVERLAPYLGDFNAQVWVKVVAQRNLGIEPEDLSVAELPNLLEGLRPSLNTFMGRSAADELLKKVSREVR